MQLQVECTFGPLQQFVLCRVGSKASYIAQTVEAPGARQYHDHDLADRSLGGSAYLAQSQSEITEHAPASATTRVGMMHATSNID